MAFENPRSSHYVSQGLDLHYVEWGRQDAPPLILLHGGLDHCRNWDWVAAGLCDHWRIIAPDLRGHGDSAHAPGRYAMECWVHDLTELVRQLDLAPLPIVAHSLGGNIALRYAGLYPERVSRLVAIEGLGPAPAIRAEREAVPVDERLRRWMDRWRVSEARIPRRYAHFEDALARMAAENPHLSPERARHLTRHGTRANADGSWSWKFDNMIRVEQPIDLTAAELATLWGRISCPTLLVYGADSWASNPAEDGRLQHFRNARVSLYENAGHWVHHDRCDAFVAELRMFLENE